MQYGGDDSCLGEDTLVALVERTADDAARARAEGHASRCARCRAVLSDLARGVSTAPTELAATTPGDASPSVPPLGERAGRYELREILGAGGMGVVYAAHDPELNRPVAIKVLRSGLQGLEARLRREAQAMAQLSHPNVVGVYDVGVVDGRVFVAMERVDGETLGAWAKRRRADEILAALVAAGRGLAAAHAAGIVHRDVKPENILVGRDGRARIGDFGLALTGEEDVSGMGIAGTPYYMAPEQRRGETVDARSDQYAFAVAAQTVLGERRVPARVKRALARARSEDPAARFATIDALLAELAPRRSRAVLLAAAGATIAVAAFAWPRGASESCDATRHLRGVWDAPRTTAIDAALARTGAPFAAATSAEVKRIVDDHAQRWVAMRTDVCEATRRRDEPENLLALRTTCLDGRLRELRALGDRLLEADREVAERAVRAAHLLSPVDTCADLDALTAPVPPPTDPATKKRVDAARDLVIDARSLLAAGKYKDGLARATQAVAEARAIGYRPLEAAALHVEGELADELGDFATAAKSLDAAVWAAEAGRDDVLAIKALGEQITVVGEHQADHAAALALRPRVTAILERAKNPPALEAGLLEAVGKVEVEAADYAAATRDLERALALVEQAYGKDDLHATEILRALGNISVLTDDAGAAIPRFERALAIERAGQGDDHPDVAAALEALAGAQYMKGDYDTAAASYERALAVYERAFGPDHHAVGSIRHNLGLVRAWQGDDAAAIPLFERAVAIDEKSLPKDHPYTASHLSSLADAYERVGRLDDAAAAVERHRDHRARQPRQDRLPHPDRLPPPRSAANRVGTLRALRR
jgi:tetratricopeptide (TPR) repeat protein/predicted Ser/Thr protein kinase